jgi:hypothetical protein
MEMARRTFNKSEHIRKVHRETGFKGKKLAEELQRRDPNHYKGKATSITAYVYTVLSSSKGKKGRRTAASNGAAAAAPKTRNVPLIDQLRQLAGMIGKDGVKQLVDRL